MAPVLTARRGNVGSAITSLGPWAPSSGETTAHPGAALSSIVRAAPSIRLSILAPCADAASTRPPRRRRAAWRSSSAVSLRVRIVGRATTRNRTYPRRHASATFDLVDSQVLGKMDRPGDVHVVSMRQQCRHPDRTLRHLRVLAERQVGGAGFWQVPSATAVYVVATVARAVCPPGDGFCPTTKL